MKDVLDKAYEFNNALEQNYLALAVCLHEIQETEAWKGEYEDFTDFYKKGLGREKSTVSRLLTAGKWLKENYQSQLPEATSYKRLCQAIKTFPDREPDFVVAYAQNWDERDFREEHFERICGVEESHETSGEFFSPCKKCGKFIRV